MRYKHLAVINSQNRLVFLIDAIFFCETAYHLKSIFENPVSFWKSRPVPGRDGTGHGIVPTLLLPLLHRLVLLHTMFSSPFLKTKPPQNDGESNGVEQIGSGRFDSLTTPSFGPRGGGFGGRWEDDTPRKRHAFRAATLARYRRQLPLGFRRRNWAV